MHPLDYSRRARAFAQYKHADYPILALAEEAGEVLGKLAKYSRKHDVTLSVAMSHAQTPSKPESIQLHDDIKKELSPRHS